MIYHKISLEIQTKIMIQMSKRKMINAEINKVFCVIVCILLLTAWLRGGLLTQNVSNYRKCRLILYILQYDNVKITY